MNNLVDLIRKKQYEMQNKFDIMNEAIGGNPDNLPNLNDLVKKTKDSISKIRNYKSNSNVSNNNNIPKTKNEDIEKIASSIRSQNINPNAKEKKLNNIKNFNNQAYSQGQLKAPNNLTKVKISDLRNQDKIPLFNKIFKVPESFDDNLDLFDDGYNFGDLTRTGLRYVGDTAGAALGTVADVALGASKGVAGIGENAVDLLGGGVAGIADLTGNKDFANRLRQSIANGDAHTATKMIGDWQKNIDKYSAIGDKGDEITESLGYMGALGGLGGSGGKLGKLLSNGGMFVSGAGGGLQEAYQKGATGGQAFAKAIGSGTIETLTENMFGLFGNVDTKLINNVVGKIEAGISKNLARAGLNATGEGAEEVISACLNQIWDRGIDWASQGKGVKFAEDLDWDKVIDEAFTAGITALVSGGGSTAINTINNKTATNTWTDAINKTADQQAKFAQKEELNDELEKLNNKLKKTTDSVEAQKIQNELKWKSKQLNALTNNNLVDVIKENVNENSNAENSKVKYSIAGVNGMNNAIKQDTSYLQLEKNYNKAQQMQKIGIDNETIRQNTNWFQDKNGDWKFEFSDKDMTLKENVKLEKNKTYRLGDILKHDTLFEIYPELANYDVKVMSDNEVSGVFSKINKRISLSDKLINNNKLLEGTLIHEIQHAIQNIEGFEGGKKSRKSKLAYYNSLGEIEASNTKDRFIREKYNNENINSIAPESSKVNPQHKGLNNYLNNRKLLDKVKDSMYNYFNNKNGGKSNEVNEEMDFGHNRQDSLLVDKGKYRRYVNDKNGENIQNNTRDGVENQFDYSIDKFADTNNKMSQNGFSEVLNNKKLPMQSFVYEKSDNSFVDTFRKDANRFLVNTDKARAFVSTIEKIITDKGISVRLNPNLRTNDGRVANGSYGNGVITINPNSNRAGEFLAIHELTHAIGTQQMLDMVDNYRHFDTEFNEQVKSLIENYKASELTEEALADVSGQLFGNQEFINSLSQKNPNLFKRIYNEIKYLWHQFRGYKNQNQFINDLHYKWEQAYRKNSTFNDSTNYSIQTDNNGNKYVKVDTNQNIFEGKSLKEQKQIARDYILNNFRENGIIKSNENINISRRTANEYTNPKNIDNRKQLSDKLKASTELDNLLTISRYKYSAKDDGRHIFANKGWDYYETTFQIGSKAYTGLLNIANGDKGKLLYDITQIKETTIPYSVKTVSMNSSSYNNSILPTKEDVNRNTTKYSMQESENNSGSFKLPTKQWSQYLNDNFKATGTRTNLNEIKLPTKEWLENRKNDNIKLPTKEYFENKEKLNLLTDKDYEVLNKIYEKEGRTEVLTEKKKASLLEKYASDKFAIKDSLDILAQKFVNKGHYVDKLAKEANNPELKFIYDKNLNSFAEGQYVVGVAQTDNKGNIIGKSINDIWSPLEKKGLVKEFSEYLLHKHNIARSGKGKYIFGNEIGPTESTSIALKLEQEHPEFKEYAKSIKEFNHNNLNNMRESGLISQDIIDYLETMYPDYIVVSRNVEDSLYTKSNDNTGTTAPIKKATGGNADIQPIKDAMANQAIRIKRLINQNELGKELAKTLKNAKVQENCDIQVSPSMLLDMESMVETDVSGNKYYVYFENGKQVKLKIDDNLFESLKPSQINRLEKTLPFKAVQKVSSVHRSLLTSSNPLFVVTNFFKDFQDGWFNSKYSKKFIKNYGKAFHEIYTKGKYYQSYMANGGMTNTYFDYNEGVKKKSNKFVEKIRNANEIVEELPRLAEFISTLEDGKSLNEALYNAADITTNFKRGGDITKAINRNGVNFLNASVQGLDKFYRNISGQNGIKGYVNLLAKATIMSIAPSILNHILLDDDKDYQDLPQSTKDLYYLFKTGDGKFIRIPKGRILSIFGSVARRTVEDAQGQDDAWDGIGDTIVNQIAPNNPLEDNILAPIMQVKNNKTWYGGDLVSSRLQKELPKNQYDETTDELSKWLGGKLNLSPKKINYLLDQYSGGIGDVLLPIITPQAKQNVLVDKFTTDSVLKNKNVSKFYITLEKQTQIANDSFATDEDKVKLKYLNSVSSDMSDLYKEKRAIQMSNISNNEKTTKVREIQSKINELAEKGLNNYNSVKVNNSYSEVGNQEYYKNEKGKWNVLDDDKKSKIGDLSVDIYSDYIKKVSDKKQNQVSVGKLNKNQDLKSADKIQILLDSDYFNSNIQKIYEKYLVKDDNTEYGIMKSSGINIKEYLKYKQQKFESDKKDDGTVSGKSVSGSKKKKVYAYVNSMKISYNQRLLLLGQQYKLNDDERTKLAKYVNSMKLSKNEKLKIYSKLQGFTVMKDGTVKW